MNLKLISADLQIDYILTDPAGLGEEGDLESRCV